MMPNVASRAASDTPRLVVLGCGFGGYSLLYNLRRDRWHATLISPRNYFLFTPLLCEVDQQMATFERLQPVM